MAEGSLTDGRGLARRLDAAGWGLFFIWVGIALLLDLGWGVGLVGVAVITLGAQAVRRSVGLHLEGFWVVVGLLFLVGGIWELFQLKVDLVPILLIVAGAALLLPILGGSRSRRTRPRGGPSAGDEVTRE